jgi:hypothetical protein
MIARRFFFSSATVVAMAGAGLAARLGRSIARARRCHSRTG